MIARKTDRIQGFGCVYDVETVSLRIFGLSVVLWQRTRKVPLK